MMLMSSLSYGQDTIRLAKRPDAIIKGWYPEFKDFPDLQIGKRKILITTVPDFDNTSIGNNAISLISHNESIEIKEKEKSNQYSILVNPTDVTSIEFELWFEQEDETILISQEGEWKDIRTLYHIDGNRILIDTIQLKLKK